MALRNPTSRLLYEICKILTVKFPNMRVDEAVHLASEIVEVFDEIYGDD